MFKINKELDTSDMHSPIPMLRAMRALSRLDQGDILLVTSTEPRSVENLPLLCRQTGNELLEQSEWNGEYTFLIRKT